MSFKEVSSLRISGGTLNSVNGNLNQYNFGGLTSENGIEILSRYVSPTAFHDSSQRFPPPKCDPGTRTAVQSILSRWASAHSGCGASTENLLWLHGPAGAGKSAVAQTMAETWSSEGTLGAAFFFSRWRAGGATGERLFTSIAFQLALNIPQLREAIGRAVEMDPMIPEKSLEVQAQALLVAPIKSLDVSLAHPFVVIIDGLDECEGKTIQVVIIKVLLTLASMNSLPLRFLIASRPEPHLHDVFDMPPSSQVVCRLVLDDTFRPALDIFRYLRQHLANVYRKRYPRRTSLESSAWPSAHDLERLVQNASGHFIYAATVIKFVDDEYSLPEERLRAVLDAPRCAHSAFADLDALYRHILSANPNTGLVVRVLGAYFAISARTTHSGQKPSVRFLDALLDLPGGTARLALRGLHSVLHIPSSDDMGIRTHHASLYDYLTSETRAGEFYLDMGRQDFEVVLCCLRIVQESHLDPYRYADSIVSYCHSSWEHHYAPSARLDAVIVECLVGFCNVLQAQTLSTLCRHPNAITLVLVRTLEFLYTLKDFGNFEIACQSASVWSNLWLRIFEPSADILEYLTRGRTEQNGTLQCHYSVNSSLAVVMERIWDYSYSRKKAEEYLDQCSEAARVCAAEYALKLLIRSARPHLQTRGFCWRMVSPTQPGTEKSKSTILVSANHAPRV
ncbi:hypothetical protein GGX14DRAFT_493110 [Mycena pura]|uniref:NACHT domain-containing protein n=1 Tax=Mycena pura TaxID=153505 RepID=A0AAD6VST0_9AGAR|nr:hypothetical protein GGX14DRAFT_493110 [Mycena pura]